jgi:hypothetical protein
MCRSSLRVVACYSTVLLSSSFKPAAEMRRLARHFTSCVCVCVCVCVRVWVCVCARARIVLYNLVLLCKHDILKQPCLHQDTLPTSTPPCLGLPSGATHTHKNAYIKHAHFTHTSLLGTYSSVKESESMNHGLIFYLKCAPCVGTASKALLRKWFATLFHIRPISTTSGLLWELDTNGNLSYSVLWDTTDK